MEETLTLERDVFYTALAFIDSDIRRRGSSSQVKGQRGDTIFKDILILYAIEIV